MFGEKEENYDFRKELLCANKPNVCDKSIVAEAGELSLANGVFFTGEDSPIDHLEEFFDHKIPVLLIAGGSDEVVPFLENGAIMSDKAKELNSRLELILKKDCGHHPHSLEDVTPIIEFVER